MAFSVATFNVKDLLDESVPPLSEDPEAARRLYRAKLDAIAPMVRRLDADVIAFQEVSSARVLDDLKALLPAHNGRPHGGYHAAIAGSADRRGIACGVLSRFPVIATCDHRPRDLEFPAFRAGDARPFPETRVHAHRGVLEAQLAMPDGSKLVLLDLHLKSNLPIPLEDEQMQPVPFDGHHAHAEGLVRSLVTRVAEALFVRKLVDAWIDADPNVALIVAGDFNDTEQSVVVRAVTGDLVLGAAQGGTVREGDAFAGRALIPCARAIPPEQRYSIAFRGSVAQIDHLLVSRALYARFVKAKFFNETLLEDLAAQGPGGVGSLASDHAPLRADFL
jgi:endonuclease/exonuclease/phosphatase family metal-dependent hydrolase